MRPFSAISNKISAYYSLYYPLYYSLGRFHSLSGAWYLVIPCWWGGVLAYAHNTGGILDRMNDINFTRSILFLLLFTLGALSMRACGCAWNDLIDRKIDALTERTRLRPLASQALSKCQAIGFIFITAACGGGILLLLVFLSDGLLLLYFALAAVPLAALYPFAKRFTYFPQVFLGCVFNWGIFCGFAAVQAKFALSAFVLFLGAICWTVVYDTVYAFQDIADDERTGMKSLTFLLQGRHAKNILCLLYGCFLLAGLLSLWVAGGADSDFGLELLAPSCVAIGIGISFLHDIRRVRLVDGVCCMKFFRHECWRGGGGMLCILVLGAVL